MHPSATQNRNVHGTAIRDHINMDNTLGGTHLPKFTNAGSYVASPSGTTDKPNIDWSQVTAAPLRFSDIHCHPMDYTGKGLHIAVMLKAALENGVNRFTVIPIPTNIISPLNDKQRAVVRECAHHCGEHYYVPNAINNAGLRLTKKQLEELQERSELYVNTGIDDILANQVYEAVKEGQIEPQHLQKMDLAMTGLHLGDMHSVNHMLKKLAHIANLDAALKADPNLAAQMQGETLNFTHVGEVTIHKELVEGLFAGKAQANLKTNIEPTRQAMRMAGVIGMPWILHCDVDTAEDLKSFREKGQPPKHLEDIKELMRSCPNTDIIWAHAGGLGRFVKAGEGHVNSLRELMEDPTLAHVKLDISWSQVAEQLSSPRDFEAWANFLVDYKDRIIFGSDTLTPQTDAKWTETYDIYNDKTKSGTGESLVDAVNRLDQQKNGSLPANETAVHKIMLGNYDSVMLPARERVNAFTKHVLPELIDGARSIAGPAIAGDIVQGAQDLRNQIFAEKAAQDPSLAGILAHYKRRDEQLLDFTMPEKERNLQPLKGFANQVSLGHSYKNYAPGSGLSGDHKRNAQLKQTLAELEGRLDALQDQIPANRGGQKEALTRDVGSLRRELGLFLRNVDTSNPPDPASVTAFTAKLDAATRKWQPLPAVPLPEEA